MKEHWIEESNSSDYSDEYDDPPTTISTQASSTKSSQQNFLDSSHDVQSRHELSKELYHLVLAKRKRKRLTNANNETYEWPPIVKQIIRCRYPSDIRDYVRYKQPTVSFTLDIFIDLFCSVIIVLF